MICSRIQKAIAEQASQLQPGKGRRRFGLRKDLPGTTAWKESVTKALQAIELRHCKPWLEG